MNLDAVLQNRCVGQEVSASSDPTPRLSRAAEPFGGLPPHCHCGLSAAPPSKNHPTAVRWPFTLLRLTSGASSLFTDVLMTGAFLDNQTRTRRREFEHEFRSNGILGSMLRLKSAPLRATRASTKLRQLPRLQRCSNVGYERLM